MTRLRSGHLPQRALLAVYTAGAGRHTTGAVVTSRWEKHVMKRWTPLILATSCLAVTLLSLPSVPAGTNKKTRAAALLDGLRSVQAPAKPQWEYAYNLKCRNSEQTQFDKEVRTFGVEIYHENKDRALYLTETGMVAVGSAANVKKNKPPLPPTWLHKLDANVRPSGFEPPLKKFGMEVFRDEQNGHWMYICETGALAALPGAGDFKPAKAAKNAVWLHGLDLMVRKADEKGFDKDTRVWGVEVFRDANNGHLVYIGESGMFAIVPGPEGGAAPTKDPKGPVWLYSFELKVPKAVPPQVAFATFGVEVYRDENNGNLIYATEAGGLAVVRGKEKLQPPPGQAKPPALKQQFELKCRRADEATFKDLAYGVATFTDATSACTLYITEKGAIAAVAGP